MVIDDTDILLKNLIDDKSKSKSRIIAVDGNLKVGKSKISEKIAKKLNGVVIELDKFIETNKGYYVKAIKRDELLTNIRNNVDRCPLIIEGICVLEVLDGLNLNADILIYIKSVDQDGEWLDGIFFEALQSPEEVFLKEKEDSAHVSKLLPELFQINEDDLDEDSIPHEIIRYHYKYKPHIIANYIINIFLVVN